MRRHRAGRVDGDPALLRPAAKGLWHIGKERALQFARLEAGLPDFALQGLECGGFAVAVHEPQQIGARIQFIPDFDATGRAVVGLFRTVLFGKQFQILLHVGPHQVLLQIVGQMLPRIRKQLLAHQREGRDSAFHVTEKNSRLNHAHAEIFVEACCPRYTGPKQSG